MKTEVWFEIKEKKKQTVMFKPKRIVPFILFGGNKQRIWWIKEKITTKTEMKILQKWKLLTWWYFILLF